ncbi:MAG: hypothetical protein HDS66_07710 [Bacteroidales bacterium]|nr:hypothetical protein [Bacteroidales bacterium]
MTVLRPIFLTVLLCCAALAAVAQRTVTPVETDDKKPEAPTLHYFDKHGDPLKEPVLFLSQLDTVQSVSAAAKPVYPRIYALDVGLNFFDGILAIAGQKHGGADVLASLSMWNWLFPTVEFGIGMAKNTPDPGNFTYKGKPSVYFKLGADYNFLYKSNPHYRVLVGLRAGYSPFSFDITDISMESPYWQEHQSLELLGNKSHAWWGEALAGLRVNIAGDWSLGWTFRYHFLFGKPKSAAGNPWYIPGYGTQSSPISATFSIIYTFCR